VQFALDSKSDDYHVIEVNPRLSRSSALASKATGYPIAFIAAKLALGYSITELKNKVTDITTACFEPSLDYVALKIPRWDLQKFPKVIKTLGSEMKSVGEVMSIARSFEESLQKAIRMLDIGVELLCNDNDFKNIEEELKNPSDKRILAVVQAIKNGISINKIHRLTGIDNWFLYKLDGIVKIEKLIKRHTIDNIQKALLKEAKQKGFSDKQLADLLKTTEEQVRKKRKLFRIVPHIKQIDTLAAEWPAKTNYLYMTYNAETDDLEIRSKARSIIVLGSGCYRIGSSVEFDWCAVNTVWALEKLRCGTIMINCNPETVSTDYDICDKLYFEELTFERVADIYEKERPAGIILSVGGQTPNNLALKCSRAGMKILGTRAKSIDIAENREKFSCLLDKLNIVQPEWKRLKSISKAKEFAQKRYPVLIRPSYVLSGAAMSVAFNDNDLDDYLKKATEVSKEYPVVISKFIEEARELEIDAVAQQGSLIVYAITEHVENAGVHSGDATMVLPTHKTYASTIKQVEEITKKIAAALSIDGPFNIQFIAKENKVKVIELNLRASRSLPFISKGIKAPQFSFSRLVGADPVLGVEMASTGEVACLSSDFDDALLKALIATGYVIPQKNILVSIGSSAHKQKFINSAIILNNLGFNLFATKHTHHFLKKNGIYSKMLHKITEKEPNILSYIQKKKLDFVFNIPDILEKRVFEDEYIIRRKSLDFNIPLITDLNLAIAFVNALARKKGVEPEIREWDEY
jgi:carbamoyl-phosphate synthase large subunit